MTHCRSRGPGRRAGRERSLCACVYCVFVCGASDAAAHRGGGSYKKNVHHETGKERVARGRRRSWRRGASSALTLFNATTLTAAPLSPLAPTQQGAAYPPSFRARKRGVATAKHATEKEAVARLAHVRDRRTVPNARRPVAAAGMARPGTRRGAGLPSAAPNWRRASAAGPSAFARRRGGRQLLPRPRAPGATLARTPAAARPDSRRRPARGRGRSRPS